MGNQLRFGVGLYFRNLVPLALLGLPIYIPSNILLEVLTDQADLATQFRIATIHQMVMGSLQAGVIITALSQLAHQRPIQFAQAWRAGFNNWFTIFGTNFVATLVTGVCLLAFIIPGLFCYVRFAFINQAIVLEGYGGRFARERSWEVTRHCWLQILLTGIVWFVINLSVGLWPAIALGDDSDPEIFVILSLINSCVMDLVQPLFIAIFFSYYWHTTGLDQPQAETADSADPSEQGEMADQLPWQSDAK